MKEESTGGVGLDFTRRTDSDSSERAGSTSALRPHRYENIFGSDWNEILSFAERAVAEDRSGFFLNSEDKKIWLMTDQSQRSKNYHSHSWDMLDPLLAAYDAHGEIKWLELATNVARSWVKLFANEAEYSSPVGECHMAWYDMAVALRAYRLAYIIDARRCIGRDGDDLDLALWSALVLHADYLSREANFRAHNNHGFYQAAGQLAMGRRFAPIDATMAHARRQGEMRFASMLHQQFADDGIHREHSPDYHRMVYRTAKSVVDVGLIGDVGTLAFLEQIERALSWFILPSGHIANIGDSDSHEFRLSRKQARRLWSTTEMHYVMTGGAIGLAPENTYAVFPEGGYFAARIPNSVDACSRSDSYIVQQAAFHSRTHKQADTLSFLWSDRNHRILVDSGRYGYLGKTEPGSKEHREGFWYSDPFRMYCESTRAHNCLEFDGRDYPRRNVTPFGSGIGRAASDPTNRIVGFETEARQFDGITQVRLLFLCANEWLVCVDWFGDEKTKCHDVTQHFHFAPGIKVGNHGNDGFEALLPRHDTPLQVKSLLDDIDHQDHAHGQTEPRLLGWLSRGYRKIEPISTIGMTQSSRHSGAFATLFHFAETVEPVRSISAIAPEARSGSIHWVADGVAHNLQFNRPQVGVFTLAHDAR